VHVFITKVISFGTTDNLGHSCVELESIGPHPRCHDVDTCRNLSLQLRSICGMTNAVYLRVISVQMRTQIVQLNEPQ